MRQLRKRAVTAFRFPLAEIRVDAGKRPLSLLTEQNYSSDECGGRSGEKSPCETLESGSKLFRKRDGGAGFTLWASYCPPAAKAPVSRGTTARTKVPRPGRDSIASSP